MEHASAPPPTRLGLPLVISRILPRDSKDEDCTPLPDRNPCEKPAISTTKTFIIIIILSAVFLCAIGGVLLYLHLRKRKMDKAEALKDLQELDDYGLAPESPQKSQPASHMPQPPPPAQQEYQPSLSKKDAHQSWTQGTPSYYTSRRTSQESLTPSLRQATPVIPRDGFSNR